MEDKYLTRYFTNEKFILFFFYAARAPGVTAVVWCATSQWAELQRSQNGGHLQQLQFVSVRFSHVTNSDCFLTLNRCVSFRLSVCVKSVYFQVSEEIRGVI